MKGCNFREVIGNKCSFVNAILSGAEMRLAHMKDCDFSNAKMSGIDLRDSVCDNSLFIDANLIIGNLERVSFHS